MNKTFSINLGGTLFHIDENAYEYTQKYLQSIKKHFSTSEGCDEILYDIEVRMAELFTEHLRGKNIISMNEVEEVIIIMGKPEDFGAESIDDAQTGEKSGQEKKEAKFKTGKRFFRDPDQKKLGGVCSGMAAYFGVDDPVWIRLLFILFTIFGGFGFMTYLILWLIVPEAQTAADKLSMRGEAANVENIARVIEDEMNDLGDRISSWGNQSQDKKKGSTVSGPVGSLINFLGSVMSSFLNFAGKVISFMISIILPFIKFIIILWIGGLVLFIPISIFGISVMKPVFELFGPSSEEWTNLGIIGVYGTFLIPLISLILFLLSLVMKIKIYRAVNITLTILWIGFIILASWATSKTMMEYQSYAKMEKDTAILIKDDTITIHRTSISGDGFVFEDALQLDGDKVTIGNVDVEVKTSADSMVRIVQKISSRGINQAQAKILSSHIQHNFRIEGNQIYIDPLSFPAGDKFRNQKADVIIYVPENKIVNRSSHSYHIDIDVNIDPWEKKQLERF